MNGYLWLPVTGVPSGAVPAALLFASGGGKRPLRVLLVEDDVAIAEMYRMQLEADGYTVSLVHDGLRGLEMLLAGGFDLALVDVRLPGLDGFTLLQESRSRGNETPAVFVTNFGSDDMRVAGQSLGALDYIVKSQVTPQWISARIPEWLRGRDN